jgi:ribosomal protein S18 acetylase RimI-like enzyme
MNVELRPAAPGDDAFVRGLIAEAVTLELGASDWPEPLRRQIVPLQVSARYSSVVGSFPAGESHILRLDGEDAGWLYFARLESEIRLVEVVVANRLRGRGAGTAAVRRVIELAAGLPVRLHVRMSNTGARRLYEQLGFRRIAGDEVNLLMEYPGIASC